MPRLFSPALAASFLCLGASAALAQPAATPQASPQPEVTAEHPDQAIYDDVNADRAWVTPTALTQPAGSFSFNDYELFLVGATYGVTDQLQLSATTMLPLFEDQPFLGILGAKYQLLNQGRLRVAAHGTVTHVRVDYMDEEGLDDSEAGTALTLGGVATLCLQTGCHSNLSAYLTTGYAVGEDDDGTPLIAAISGTARLTDHVKLVGELDTAFVPGESDADGVLAWYGVRFTSRNIGADIGFAKPIAFDDEDNDDPLVLGLPWVNFTYRAM